MASNLQFILLIVLLAVDGSGNWAAAAHLGALSVITTLQNRKRNYLKVQLSIKKYIFIINVFLWTLR